MGKYLGEFKDKFFVDGLKHRLKPYLFIVSVEMSNSLFSKLN